MKAIILAAGRGSRLASLTDKQPKCFTRLKGRPLIDWQLGALKCAGIEGRDISVVTGYQSHCFRLELTYFCNKRWSEMNMVGSLVCASEWLEREPCIVSYSDIVYSSDVVQQLLVTTGDIVISYDPNWLELWRLRFEEPLDDAETFREQNGCLLEIGAQPECVDTVEGQFMGILKFTPAGWAEVLAYWQSLPSHLQKSLDMTGLLSGLLAQGTLIKTVPIVDRWFEVDSENDLQAYERLDLTEFPIIS